MEQHVIFAPHVDDAVIGCFGIIMKQSCEVYYAVPPTEERKHEARTAGTHLGFTPNFLEVGGIANLVFRVVSELGNDTIVWAPDPHWEQHPLHKALGAMVVEACRGAELQFGSYSTNMNVPYLHELSKEQKVEKRNALTYFPSQQDLWHYDHKYFLFEGRSLWCDRDS